MKNFFKKLVRKITPAKFKKILLHGFDEYQLVENGWAQVTYSQQGEDLELARIFQKINNGLYVDIGAFHPFLYSNTYKLYLKGWRGINIEPNPDHQKLFHIHRPGDINLNIGISREKSLLDYYHFNAPAVNTFNVKHAEEWSAVKGFEIKEVKKIPTEPLKEIFEKYVQDKRIDLLNIDVEGMDLEVLQSNDWQKFRPHIILAEDAWYQRASLADSGVYQFLSANGYALSNIVGITLVFTDTLNNRHLTAV